MRSKPHQNQQPSGAAPPPENPTHPKTPMGNFRALVMTMAMNSTPNKSLSPAQRIFVHQKLQEFFPDSKPSPDHPPYSWMIQKAIENLNEEGGSSEEAISEYIVKENSNLPWAHTTLLSHHLRKLCKSNEIFETVDGYYALSNPITTSSPNECISSEHSSDKKRVNPENMQKDSEKVQMNAEKEATEEEDRLLEERIDVIEEQHPPHGLMYQNDQEGQEEPANLKLDIEPRVLDDNAHVEPKEQPKQDLVSQECYEDEEQQLSIEQVHESGERRPGKALTRKRGKMVVEEEEEEIGLEIDVQLQGLDGSARKGPNKQVQQDMMSECNEEQQPKREQGQQKGRRLGILLKRRIKKVQEEENNLEIDGQPLRFEDDARKEANKQMQQDVVSEKCRGEQLNMEQELEKGARRSSRVAKRNRKNNDLEEQTNKEIHVLTQRLEDTDPEEPYEQIQQDLVSEEYNKDEGQQPNTEQALEKRKRKQGKPRKNVVEKLINSETDFQRKELDAQNENRRMQQGFTSKECSKAEEQRLNREHEQIILKAIENLNEEGGSTEVAIAKYIARENSNLPWAYTALLSRHLRKLCQRNEIFETVDGYYALSCPPITNIRPTSSPNECISSKHSSVKKTVNPKNIKKDSNRRKGKFGKCNVRGQKVQTNTDEETSEEEDIVSQECYKDEEQQLNSKQVHESGKRRPGKALKRKRRKLVVEEEDEEIDLEVNVQWLQKGRMLGMLPKRRIKEVVQEENNLEMDGQRLRFDDGARKEPNKKMRQDVSEKCRGEQLNREQEPQKGKRRSSSVPKRNRKNNDLQEQTNMEIHGLKDTEPEEPNEQVQQDLEIEECNKDEEQQLNTKQALEKGKRKQGKPHKNVVEEPTNSESDSQPQELDDAQNENEQMQQGFTSNECREAEEQQLKRKTKPGSRQQHLQPLQTCRPKTKSSDALLTKPSAHSLQSSSQNSVQLGDRKHIKHEGSAKCQEIRRSTRISISTSKKKEYNGAT